MGTKADGDSSVDAGQRVDPFHDSYLADPYPFFAKARAATPVFCNPDLDYWVVTRLCPSPPGVAGVRVWQITSR